MRKQYSLYLLFFLITSLCFSQQTPLNFDDTADNFSVFGGTSFAIVNNPQDSNDKVGQFQNIGANASEGFYIDLSQPIDLDAQKIISLSFYSLDADSHNVMIKLEGGTNPDVYVRQSFSVPTPSDWKELVFNFANAQYSTNDTPVNASGTYSRLTIFIDEGVTNAGTYLIDDINEGVTTIDPYALDVIYSDLVWSDEFDTNGAINSTKWFHQTQLPAGGSWFNGEEQHYTNRIENSFVNNGELNIVAIKESFTDQGETKQYTSARLNSKFAFTYGRVDVRAKLPFGEGTWPAIWTLGKNVNEDGGFWDSMFGAVSWPACGEIDIMEHGLGALNHVSSALHTPHSFGNTENVQSQLITDVANTFHKYSVNWSPDKIVFLIDDVGYYTYNPAVKNDDTWPFYQDQYLLLNVAMGGIAGTIDPSFSQSEMVIDYVRVYQDTSLSVDEVFASKFSIYPNPSSDVFNIQTDEDIDEIHLYNILGQSIINKKDVRQINIGNLQSGIYLLKIYSGSKTVTKKVIIK